MFSLYDYTEMYLMMSNTCYGSNTVFNEDTIDDGPESGVTCFRRGSTSTAGTLMDPAEDIVSCDDNPIRCKTGSGSLTVYTGGGFGNGDNGMYTCCIDERCISVRIFRRQEYEDLFDPPGELYSITLFHYI